MKNFDHNFIKFLSDQSKHLDAVSAAKSLLKSNPNSVEAISTHAYVNINAKNYELALKSYKRLNMINPDSFEAMFGSALCLSQLRRYNQAVDIYNQLILNFPNDFRAYMNLGVLYRQMGKFDLSKQILDQASKLEPKNSEIFHNLAITIEHMGDLETALKIYNHVLSLNPSHFRAICNQGTIYSQKNKLDEAEEKFLRALSIKPDDELSLNNLGLVYIFKKKTHNAKTMFLKAINSNPLSGKGYINFASLNNLKCDEINLIINKLEKLIFKKASFQFYDKALFALANLYEKRSEFRKAEQLYLMGNNYVSKFRPFNQSKNTIHYERLLDTVDIFSCSENIDKKNNKNYIFIIGMPRSGTTLLESILASNNIIQPGDELPFLNKICKEFIFDRKQPLTSFNKNDLKTISNYYIENTIHLFGKNSWLIDKLPHNFQWACIIAKIFPNAKILHCHRDPMDNCWSLYRANFEQGHTYSFSMKSLGQYYAQYQNLLIQFQKVLGDRIFNVNYDELVLDPVKYSKSIFEYIGFPNFKFDESNRGKNYFSRTTSSVDVQKPISKSSLNGWKKHESFLDPLLRSLISEQIKLCIPIYGKNN